MGMQAKQVNCDVVIIGAGLIGLSAADSLLRRGASVMLAEIKPTPMSGTSARNSGMVHPSQALPWAALELPEGRRRAAAEAVFEIAQKSAPLITARAKALRLPQAARPDGCLKVYKNRAALLAAKAGYTALGVDCRSAERQDIGDVDIFAGRPALFFPQDSSGNAREYGLALADELAARGAVFCAGQGAAIWLEGERAIGARLGNRNIRARHTLLAAGPHSGEIAARAGLDLPLSTLSGWAVDYRAPSGISLPPHPVMDAQSHSALSVFGDVLRFSGTAGETDAGPLLARWAALAPEIFEGLGAPLTPARRALRPISLTGAPLIGRSHMPGLWVNTGHGHMGWTLCAGSGELLADMMEGGPSDPRFALRAVDTL